MWLEFWGLYGQLSLHAGFPWGFPDPEDLPVVRGLTGKFWGPGVTIPGQEMEATNLLWSPQAPSHFLQVPWKTVVPVPRPLSRKNSLLLRRGWPFCSIQAVDRLDEAHSHYRRQSAYSVHKFTCYFHPKTSSEKYLELCWNTELWPSQADISKINPRTFPASSSFTLVAQMLKNLSATQDTQV